MSPGPAGPRRSRLGPGNSSPHTVNALPRRVEEGGSPPTRTKRISGPKPRLSRPGPSPPARRPTRAAPRAAPARSHTPPARQASPPPPPSARARCGLSAPHCLGAGHGARAAGADRAPPRRGRRPRVTAKEAEASPGRAGGRAGRCRRRGCSLRSRSSEDCLCCLLFLLRPQSSPPSSRSSKAPLSPHPLTPHPRERGLGNTGEWLWGRVAAPSSASPSFKTWSDPHCKSCAPKRRREWCSLPGAAGSSPC